MDFFYRYLIWALWLAWLIYWRASSFNVKSARRKEPPWARIAHAVPLLLAVVLVMINPQPDGGFLFQRFIAASLTQYATGVGLLLLGLGLSVWARIELGRNWSDTVTIKDDHELVVRGPYARIRHPIYSGILLAFVGTAIARGEWRGLLSVVLVFVAFWQKLRREERWMRETFGDAYALYCRRTAALIPFVF